MTTTSNSRPKHVATGTLDYLAWRQKQELAQRDRAIQRLLTPSFPKYPDAPDDPVDTQVAFFDKDTVPAEPEGQNRPYYYKDAAWHPFGQAFSDLGHPAASIHTGVAGDLDSQWPQSVGIGGDNPPLDRVPFTCVRDYSDIEANSGTDGFDGEGFVYRYQTGTGPGATPTPTTVIASVDARRPGWYMCRVEVAFKGFDGSYFVVTRAGAAGYIYDPTEAVEQTSWSADYAGLGIGEAPVVGGPLTAPTANPPPWPWMENHGISYTWIAEVPDGGWYNVIALSYMHDAGNTLRHCSAEATAVYLGPWPKNQGTVTTGSTKVV